MAILLGLLRFDRAIGDVDVLGRNVDAIEKGFLHPAPVTLRVVRLHGEVFVEVERYDAREVECGLAVQSDQFAVQADGSGAGRQSEHGGPAGRVVLADEAFDHQGHVPRRLRASGENERWGLGMGHVMRRHDDHGIPWIGASGHLSFSRDAQRSAPLRVAAKRKAE